MTAMARVGGRGWEEEGNTNTAAPAEHQDTAPAAEAKDEGEAIAQGARSTGMPAKSSNRSSAMGALRHRRATLLNLGREHEELEEEEEVKAASGGSAGSISPRSPSRRSPPFSAKVVLSPSQQRRLMWTAERTPLSRRGKQAKQNYRHVQRGRRPWAVFWALMLMLLVLAMPLLQTWRRLWVAHRIGVRAAFVCVVSHFFPLVDHSDDFVDGERLAQDRRRLDLANHLNMAPAIAGTEDIFVPSSKGNHSIPIRLFRPLSAGGGVKKKRKEGAMEGGKGPALSKVLVWIHGGGWTIGSIDSDDKIARRLAAATGAVVASVEYRLAPEFKYPAQVDDTVDALEFLLTQGAGFGLDTRKVAVAGESAGGHLTIVSAMALKSAKTRLCAILPVVPATDYGCDSASCDRFNDGFLLTQGQVRAFWNAKLSDPDTEQHDFLVSPLRAPQEVFDDMPPMLVMTAGLDPLRDEGEAFVARAREMGANVELKRFEHTIHGFFGRLVTGGAGGIVHAAEWLERTCEWGVLDEVEEE